MTRRKHHKIARELPPELVEAVNNLLVQGATYREIAEWLEEKGHSIGKSSVQRYGKDFLTKLERLRTVRDQAKAIIEDNPDRPATELTEAASLLASQLITEALMEIDDPKQATKLTSVFKAIADLEKSGVAREKLKFDFNRGVDAAAEKIKTGLKDELSSRPDLMARLSEMVDKQTEGVRRR